MAFGMGAALLGLEHGFFEIQRGNLAPAAPVISAIGPPCEPEAAWHGCEPALTLVPSFLVTGVLAMVVALAILVLAVAFIERRRAGVVLLGLTVLSFLVGGGFTTLWFGLVAGTAATRIGQTMTWWRGRPAATVGRGLSSLWPGLLIAYLGWAAAS